MSAVALRPYLPADAPRCAEIFRSSVEEIAARRLWRRAARGMGRAGRRRTGFRRPACGRLTLIAMIDGEIAGFASLKGADQIDMLYVDPEFARQASGRALDRSVDEARASARRKRLTGEASDTAKPLFERRLTRRARNLVRIGEQWLANTTMTKPLARRIRRLPTRH